MVRLVILVSGVVLTLGTRPGMWSGLTVLLAVAVVGVLWSPADPAPVGRTRRPRGGRRAAAAALVSIYPNVFGSPLRALPRTSEASSNFMSGEPSDRLYVPQHLWEETPTLLPAFALVGAVVALVSLLRLDSGEWVPTVRISLVGVQAFAVPVAAVLVGSDLYHGLRQLLFIVPALAVLAAFGMAWAIKRAARCFRSLVPIVGVAALALPVADQVMMHPYQTSYVDLATDLLARHQAADDRPGDDFWRVSIPELVRDVPLDRLLLCKAATDEVTMVAYPFMNGSVRSTSRNVDCREETYGPLAPAGLAVVRPSRSGTSTPCSSTPCRRTARASRRCLAGDTGSRSCWPRSPGADRAPDADRRRGPGRRPGAGHHPAGRPLAVRDGRWLQWPGRLELTAPTPQAGITFTVPASATGTAARWSSRAVLLPTSSPRRRRPGRRATRPDGAVTVPVPARRPADTVWLTLTRSSGETLGMRLTGPAPRAWCPGRCPGRSDERTGMKSAYVSAVRALRRALGAIGLLGLLDRWAARSRTGLWLRSLLSIYDLRDLLEYDVPWWTFEASDRVAGFLAARPDARVFEWGSGASTVWLSRRAGSVTSVEHDGSWAGIVRPVLPDNAVVRVVEPVPVTAAAVPVLSEKPGFEGLDFRDYVDALDETEGTFDLVVVDGRARNACFHRAVWRLAPDGVLVFDNVDRERYRSAIATSPLPSRWSGPEVSPRHSPTPPGPPS